MEVTLGQIYASFNLLSRIVDQQLPIKLAFRFTKLIRSLNQEYQSLEGLRDKLVKKYGEEQEGGAHRVTEENREGFLKEFQELLETTVEVDWEQISVDEVSDALQFSVRELANLGWLFTEFEELRAIAEAEEAEAEAAAEEVAESEEAAPEAEAVEEAAEVG